LLASADALVLGRATYDAFAASWPGHTGELDLAEVNEVGNGVVVLTCKVRASRAGHDGR